MYEVLRGFEEIFNPLRCAFLMQTMPRCFEANHADLIGCYLSGALVTFCGPCCSGQIARRIGEHCCVPCLVPGGLMALRIKIRLMLGIRVSCNPLL